MDIPAAKYGKVKGGWMTEGGFIPQQLLDFRNVLFIIWMAVGLPEPTKMQYDIANALQNIVKPRLGLPVDKRFVVDYPHLCENGKPSPRLVLQAFRGIGKSWVTAALVVWCLMICPTLNIMVVSASKKKSDGFSTFSKRIISEVDIFQHMLPDPTKGQRWSNVAFDVADARAADQDASVYSVSVMGAMTGGRGDIIIADDVEVPNTSDTQGMREKLEERVKEFEAIVKPEGVIIFLGTPQTEDTIYTKLVAAGHVKAIWPARVPDARWLLHNGKYLAKVIAQMLVDDPGCGAGYGMAGDLGLPTDPQRFDDSDLIRREARYGRSGFSLQFMLDSSLSDADRYPLKLKDLIIMDFGADGLQGRPVWSAGKSTLDPALPCVGFTGDRWVRAVDFLGEEQKLTNTVMAIDPSGRGKDELSYAIISHLKGYFYVHKVGGIRINGYSPEALQILAELAKEYKVNEIVAESNFGDGMFTELLKPVLRRVWPVTVTEVRHSKQKELRIIDTLEPVTNQHRLVINSAIIWDDLAVHEGETAETGLRRQLFHQYTRITKEAKCLSHDDRLDALAIGVNFWVESAAIDADEVDQREEHKAMTKRLKEVRKSKVRIGKQKGDPYKRPKGHSAKKKRALGRTGRNFLQ